MPRLPPRTPFETGLEAHSLLGLAGDALPPVSWPDLPDRVLGHYALAGTVTRYGSKGTFWSIVEINAGLYTLIGVINLLPQLWNLPSLEKPVALGTVSSVPWWFLPLGLFAPLVIIVSWFYQMSREL